ncbi:tlde1 domain-containing protein [Labrys neptuniae]
MTNARSTGSHVRSRRLRRNHTGWMVVAGLCLGATAAAGTTIALVAPALVSSTRPGPLQLRTEDPFAPKALVQTAMLRPAPRPADQQARAPDPKPLPDKGGLDIAEGARLPATGTLVRPATPLLASLTPLARDAEGSEEALPVIHSVATVAALPAPPAAEVTPDVAVTGSLAAAEPPSLPLPPIREAADDPADLIPLPPARPSLPLTTLASIAPDAARPLERPTAEPPISQPFAGNRTAIYDISARTVYLPGGERLEAHSGLGAYLDDPNSVHVKNRGATPPQTYDLKPREALFHGVAALRMIPANGSGTVLGRDGLLAHTYMLGPRGDSNGCVSFKDYARFLRAYRNGEVNRLTVVAGRGKSNSWFASRSKGGWWFASGR